MTKRVLDVGNCNADHGSVRSLLERHFDVDVDRVHNTDEALRKLHAKAYDLVLVNRLMDRDGSEGLELIQQMREEAALRTVPVMMISNFEEAQQRAIAAGARPGFGKAQLHASIALERLQACLNDNV